MGAHDNFRKRVGRRIRQAREAKGWSQHQLATAMGVADAQISRWETGQTVPQPRNLERLGQVLDVPAETFLLPDDEAS